MSTTETPTVDVATVAPLGHGEAQDLFAAEAERTLTLLRSLTPADWATQTECPEWDVRAMYLHVLGACESGASMKELAHQMLTAKRLQKREGGPLEAALSATQVADRQALGTAELVERLAAVAPRTVKRRRSMPGMVRRIRLAVDGPVVEKWSLGYLNDTIYLRDAWMHRIDTCRAVGVEPVLSEEHDGRIVADVVAEWARRHGRSFDLTLTGRAGGRFRARVDGDPSAPEVLALDAVEFCRVLAGRAPGEGLLSTIVPF